MRLKKIDLIISKVEANASHNMDTIRKKLKHRARGHSYRIKRTTCHITIVLKDISQDQIWIKNMYREIYYIYKYKQEVFLYDRSGKIEIELG